MSEDLIPFDSFTIIEQISSNGDHYKVSKDGSDYYAKITSIEVNDNNKNKILEKASKYKSISYPSISPLFEVFEKDNRLGYTSPIYSSASLKENLANLNATEKTISMYGFACALKYLKDKQIIPDNLYGLEKIVFDSDKRPILIGFYFSDLIEKEFTGEKFIFPPEIRSNNNLNESFISYVFGAFAFLIMSNTDSADQVSRQPEMPDYFPDNFKETLQKCFGNESERPTMDEIVEKFNESSFLFQDVDTEKFKQYQNFLNANNDVPIAPSESPDQITGLSTADPLEESNPPADNNEAISSLIGRSPSQRSQVSENPETQVSPEAENAQLYMEEPQNSSRAPSQRSNLSTPISPQATAVAAAVIGAETNAAEPQNINRAPSQRSQASNMSTPISPKADTDQSNFQEPQNISRAASQRSQASNVSTPVSPKADTDQYQSQVPALPNTTEQSVAPTTSVSYVRITEQYVSPDFVNPYSENYTDVVITPIHPYRVQQQPAIQSYSVQQPPAIQSSGPDLQTIITDAKNGNPDAMFCYGKMLYDGVGIPQNYHKAAYYFKQAGKRGNANGEFFYGMLLEKGQGVTQNLNKAVSHYAKSAHLGSPDGHYKYGLFLDRGICVEKSRVGATNHFKIAAEQNHPLSMYSYGYALAKGRGLPAANRELGASFVKRSADLGVAQAQNLYGFMLLKGIGVKQDVNTACKYIKMAADQQYPPALNLYGEMLVKGNMYAPKDTKKAFQLFERASKLGDMAATNNEGRMYQLGLGVDKKDDEKAFDCFYKSAENGNIQAIVNLANCYLEGKGVKKDADKAFSLFKFAADNNNVVAMIFLGNCLENGIGTKINTKEAYKYYENAAEKNNCAALYHKGRCLLHGIGVKKNKKEAKEVLKDAAQLGSERASKLIANNYK